MYGVNLPSLVTISVSSGVGTLATRLDGKVLAVGIVAPSSVAVYDLEILDVDGFGVAHVDDGVGNMTIAYGTRFYGPHNIYLTNATDGEYKIKIWYE